MTEVMRASSGTGMDGELLSSQRGIPPMKFIESVDDYMSDVLGEGRPIDECVKTVIQQLEEMYQKYKYTEASMLQQKLRMKQKLPELRNSLDLLLVLAEKRGRSEAATTRFLLSDQCYAQATIEPTDNVHLWLGANVMLEYKIEDARDLLEKNMNAAQKSVRELSSELEFVKDQITTCEVNIARIYNWGVQKRREQLDAK